MSGKKLRKKRRRCPNCGCLFRPGPRSGDRQRYCSKPACQRERHCQSCKRWHEKNLGYNRDERTRKKLAPKKKAEPPDSLDADPIMQLDLSAIRLDVGSAVVVVFEEVSRVTRVWTRDAVRAELRSARGPPS